MKADLPAADVTLRDGRIVHIRTMRPSDEAELLQAFDRMSHDARYMRFLRAVREPDLQRLRKALASFPARGAGIVATVPATDGIDIVGSAIFVLGSDPVTCEFAITVGANYGGAGLGQALMSVLIDATRRRGLEEMVGFVLAANTPMLRLAARVGFNVERDPDDHSLRVCRLSLRDAQ